MLKQLEHIIIENNTLSFIKAKLTFVFNCTYSQTLNWSNQQSVHAIAFNKKNKQNKQCYMYYIYYYY